MPPSAETVHAVMGLVMDSVTTSDLAPRLTSTNEKLVMDSITTQVWVCCKANPPSSRLKFRHRFLAAYSIATIIR
jgi:hypothetical protein